MTIKGFPPGAHGRCQRVVQCPAQSTAPLRQLVEDHDGGREPMRLLGIARERPELGAIVQIFDDLFMRV